MSKPEVPSLFRRIACAIGLHKVVRRDKWTPSIFADVVKEFEQTHACAHCSKVLHHYRVIYDTDN